MSKKRKKSVGANRRRRSVASTPPADSPLKAASRSHVAEILHRADAGDELTDEDEEMARAMEQHPEYRWVFEQGADGPDEVDGVNPWLHVSLHSIVARQRKLLPEVEAALTRLQQRGLTEHEAQHRVAELMTHQIWSLLHDNQPFNEQEYRAQLRALE